MLVPLSVTRPPPSPSREALGFASPPHDGFAFVEKQPPWPFPDSTTLYPKRRSPATLEQALLEPFEGLFEVGDHVFGVLDTYREPHEVLSDPEPFAARR